MSQKWKIVLIIVAFIGVPILYALEVNYLNRTPHASRMMPNAVALGIIIGILLGYYLQKTVTDTVARIRTYAVCIILSVLTLPLLASMSNRLLSFRAAQAVQVEFVEESPRYSSRFGAASGKTVQADSYITFFYKEQELISIQTRQSLFPNAERGDQVILPIKKGLWGFDIVIK